MKEGVISEILKEFMCRFMNKLQLKGLEMQTRVLVFEIKFFHVRIYF